MQYKHILRLDVLMGFNEFIMLQKRIALHALCSDNNNVFRICKTRFNANIYCKGGRGARKIEKIKDDYTNKREIWMNI